jgi:hypothetical protein
VLTAVTTAVGDDSTGPPVPTELVAHSVTRIVCPTSPGARAYVCEVAPAIAAQPWPELSQSSHWWEKELGPSVQAPFTAVRVRPCSAVPVNVGVEVLTGTVIGVIVTWGSASNPIQR